MSRLPRRTSLLVDRLARRAHAFHRFAHHPLCERYASELIPLGRRARLCRGCACAALGSLSGLVLAVSLRPAPTELYAGAALGLALLGLSFRVRLPKAVGRGLAAAAASFAGVGGLLLRSTAPRLLSVSLLAAGIAFVFVYRRRGPNRSPCQACPERLGPAVCSGLRPIVLRERAFRRL